MIHAYLFVTENNKVENFCCQINSKNFLPYIHNLFNLIVFERFAAQLHFNLSSSSYLDEQKVSFEL